ncbi:Arf-GAP with SH3 domain, ANK repeat and PH domain-containing protein 2 [Bagarius yarrelli]|uniref:Arf-GAP with SH3 domain, ANK repeat and PH domain-containing protein 2 n=1 Tax=Bagarius yarrelli TaxID=175774 RepID=A0A556TK52_BAGYA|nr:Arf-GAP with SH3 domain, ANK repeat and PH domain-containing protein 2 [Bagarius yarrelli]
MPEFISVDEFIAETLEDYNSPTTSSFITKMTSCRNSVNNIEEALDCDRTILQKMKKASKVRHSSGQDHISHFELYINSMERLAVNFHNNGEQEVALAFNKFAEFSKELLTPMKNLLRSMLHNINFFLDPLVKGDLKEVKGDLKKPFDKAWRDYESKFFFQECLTATEKLKQYIDTLSGKLSFVKHSQDEEKRQLYFLRDQLRPAMQQELKEDSLSKQTVYSMHQLQGNRQYGTEKSGYLYKRSDGLRKTWQKRKCTVQNCYLTIAHGTPNKSPAKLNLLTCQVKPSLEDKKCFHLISHNRTYHFLTEDESDCVAWISVLTNSKQEALNVALDEHKQTGESSVEDLTRAITEDILRMPDPTWISTNLGILTCIECSGIHRKMGVHYSRILSLSLDKLGTSELLLARNVGNSGFNGIMEASLCSPYVKPSAESDMLARKKFILAKYIEGQFAQWRSGSPDNQCRRLQEAIHTCDIFSLLQLYTEKLDFTLPMPSPLQEKRETALHLAVLLSDRTSLHMVDFLVHNCNNLDAQTVKGNTALHYCCLHNKTECLKLLLKAKANTNIKNENSETASDIAQRLKHTYCEELIQQAQNNQFTMHIHVEYEWRLRQDDWYESDDDLEDKSGPVKRDRFFRPFSVYHSTISSHNHKGGGGGIFDVSHRLTMSKSENKREMYIVPSPQTHSLESPPPPSSPAPPLPPRVRAPNITPPLPLVSPPHGCNEVNFSKKRTPPPPLVIRHKRTYSEPSPLVPHSPRGDCSPANTDYTSSGIFSVQDLSSQKCGSGLPKGTAQVMALNALSELPEPRFRTDEKSHNSCFLYSTVQSSSLAFSPTSSHSLSMDCNGSLSSSCLSTPHPLPRQTLMKSNLRRVKAMYDCVADHHDELTFREGEVLVVLAEEDTDWWHGYIEGQPNKTGLFPASFVSILLE